MPVAKPERTIDKGLWERAYERIRRLPPERQEEIVDYIDFVLECEEGEVWELSEADQEAIARHREGDLSDTVPFDQVKDAVLRGRPDEI
jgi:hypothetical protein